ncbi:hypothetical protein PN465_06620 [Nodularia spumigena CS-584]|jgi:hypothetical protein|uniref:Uncharacterized protein n=1 Tax=Nodularia spumigena UHCC 0060 TaxID=3110300 RepID=A0ABU5UK74_NODSP|nr:hypothetical protein [Nodularia spumigena]AHJ27598.1 hypothetical protein NSP_12580 [Nodularia spumigena CCY9414]MDB9381894.1 hypothetical protein [Nodularia spumigena CS-584]MEA5526497.1 hypothetical protein [Nodularia spumigena UHCC 0143]MEA5558585.1 hypothetical protein [Nodularia spumigena CH309]MEA5606649.1 hypothetical protein [Nodularia spumigena UHCC 0060]
MKSNHISAERQPQESLWTELTEEETEKVQGGFGFFFDRNRFRNLLFNLLSQITARVREVGVQNPMTPGNESFSVERTETIIVKNGQTIFSEKTEEITVR